MHNRFAQRLGRDGAGVNGGAAEGGVLFNNCDGFPELGRLDGCLLPGRSGTDDG